MSRSNPVLHNNPTERYFEWNGADGGIKYYDKDAKENVNADMPFTFLFLDQLARIGGFDQHKEQNIWSNEVRSTQKEKLSVRSGNHIIAQGFYSDIKQDVKASGGRYVTSLYIAYKEDELKIGNLQLKGSALSAWMDFMKSNQKEVHEKAVKVEVDPEVYKKGATEYRVPVFKIVPTTPETDEQATELDKTLQEFLEAKTDASEMAETPKSDSNEPPVHTDRELPELDDIDDDLPF